VKKTICAAAALSFGLALTGTASGDQVQPHNENPFTVWPEGNWIFVMNYGNADWTGPLDVWATCKPVAPTTSCGSNFVGGKYHAGHYDPGKFPKGHGNVPMKNSENVQQVSGPGWVAVFMGLPAGTYKITATAAGKSSPETDVTTGAPQSDNTMKVKVQPAAIQLAPTKKP
jgi:hypothetical protein